MSIGRIARILSVAGLFAATTFAQQAYKAVDVRDGGTITGIVRLQGAVPKLPGYPVTKDNDWCGKRKLSPRLLVGRSGVVRNAVVSLENITRGKRAPASGTYILDQQKCEYVPHVMILPLGESLTITNDDPILHNVHVYSEEQRSLFNIAQPVRGFRFPVKPSLFGKPGIYAATCDAGHPWMSAYVVVAEHPYYALTNTDGKYHLGDVPPGTYRIRMWHEGVFVTKTEMEKGKPVSYRYEEPYEEVQEVIVPAHGEVTVDFVLRLRPEAISAK